MESINQKVWNAMRSDPAVLKGLQRGLINMRALAKFLIKTYNLRASLDAVISSIRRFPLDSVNKEEAVFRAIFKDAVISTVNNVTCLTINLPAAEVLRQLGKVACPGIRVVTGTDKVKVIVRHNDVPKIKELFKRVNEVSNLSEIAVTVSEKAIKTKGVMARIAAEIALANINIQELLVCPPQFLIYVDERNIVKAHERVLSLTEN